MPLNDIPVQAGALSGGFCPSTYQAMLNGFAAAMYIDLSSILSNAGYSVIVQSAKPNTTSSILWIQTDSLGRPLNMYIYAQGAWLSLHPTAPGLTMWWFQTLPANGVLGANGVTYLTSFDGGDGTLALPTATTGPMWQLAVDTLGNTIAAKFPIAVGTLPSATSLSVGASGGEETHILTSAEAGVDPKHRHGIGRFSTDWHQGCFETGGQLTAGFPGEAVGGSGDVPPSSQADITAFGNASNVVQSDVPVNALTTVAHNNMPPYVVGYLLQRTSRLFYAIT